MENRPFGFIITPAAKKKLKRHKHAEIELLRSFKKLTLLPESGEILRGKLQGYRSLKLHIKGSGEYRILYSIDEPNETVVVHWVGTRENFYDEAERHLFG